jgi:succinate-acetate transporter protein
LGEILFMLMVVGETLKNASVMRLADLWGAAQVAAAIQAMNKALAYMHSRPVICSFTPLNRP